MTPDRKWLTKTEIVELVVETVQPLINDHFEKYDRKINERLTDQDKLLNNISARQTENHAENSRRNDKTEKALANLLQLGENQLLIQKTRDEALAEYRRLEKDEDVERESRRKKEREDKQAAEDERNRNWDKWQKRISWLVGLAGAGGALTYVRAFYIWWATHHFFAPMPPPR